MSDTRVETVAPPLDSQGFLRWAWRQLTSMRVALILLFALAVASVPGSILPQRGNNPLLVDEWIDQRPTLGPLLDRLGFFDVYGAPWVAAIYLLLFVSLIGGVLPRVGHHWKAMRTQPPLIRSAAECTYPCIEFRGALRRGRLARDAHASALRAACALRLEIRYSLGEVFL